MFVRVVQNTNNENTHLHYTPKRLIRYIYWPFFFTCFVLLVSLVSFPSFRFAVSSWVPSESQMDFGETTLSIRNELCQISASQHLLKHGFLKSSGKLEMCFVCGANEVLKLPGCILINSKKISKQVMDMVMNFKEIMWQKFAGNLCINYLWCLYEFILADHIRNPEDVTRWIKHKVTGSFHKRIYKLQCENCSWIWKL